MDPPDRTSRPTRDGVAAVFAEALERPPSERPAFLSRACGGDEAMRAAVSSLLAAHDRHGEFLSRADPTWFRSLVAPEHELAAGAVIGSWRVLRQIGRGGMGTVYLCERADGVFEQRVALKVLRTDAAGAALPRFFRERRILARLLHPGIARLLDGGLTPSGIAWLAMEYVEGLPITAYCDARALGVRERLMLFAEACEAVRYAHGQLVVHRDLKPGNVLVTNEGHVKLLDFGIARLLDPDTAEEPALTVTGLRPMTPEYAAPEQVLGMAVTTSTDVYGLGVILYELLAGQRPYRFEARSLERIARVLREQSVRPPSVAAARPREASAAGDARARTTSTDALRRALRGDLDAIALKALRLEPEHRYPSVEALLDDVRRHLSGRPVAARSGTFTYRAGRFLRRNRAAAAAGAVAILSLIGGMVGTAWQARRAAHERDVAIREAEKAARVSTFMTQVFHLANPNKSRGEKLTVRQAVDSGRVWIERDLADEPELRGDIAYLLADVYYGLGLWDEAQALWEDALAAYRQQFGEVHGSVLGTLLSLSMALKGRGEVDSAVVVARRGLELLGRLPDTPDRVFTATNVMNRLADALRAQGRLDEAEALLNQALAILPAAHAEARNRRTVILTTLSHVRRARGDPDGAEQLLREVLRARREIWGDEHPEVANARISLAGVLMDEERFAEADTQFREALSMRLRLQGEEHPDYGVDLAHYADLLQKRGQLDDAVSTYRRALALMDATLGLHTSWGVAPRVGLGETLLALERRAEAATVLADALRIARESLGADHRLTLAAQADLARARQR